MGILFLTMKTFLLVALCDFIGNGNMVVIRLALFLGIGVVLGMLLCPLFIPSPWQKKTLSVSIAFILFLIVPNIALRSLGLPRWLASEAISNAISTLTNILYPLCYGLFFITHIAMTTLPGVSTNKTGRYGVFLFTIAIAAGMAGRYGLLPALALFGIRPDPYISMTLLYKIIFWLIAGTGASALVCVIVLNVILPDKTEEPIPIQTYSSHTDWRMIFSLIGIAMVSKILNSMMGIRFLPIINYSFLTAPHIILMTGGLVILGFLAGRSVLIFLRWYLPFSAALFILLPCIVLFDNSSRFVLLIDIILSIFTNTTWAVFTVALIELFIPGKKDLHNNYCFYLLAGAIHFTNILISLSPAISRHIPIGTGYSVWIIGIAAVALALLSISVIVPKHTNYGIAKSNNAKYSGEEAEAFWQDIPIDVSFDDIFKEHELSKRESDVAGLILKEGLGTKEIGLRLFISTHTVNSHIKKIFQKFDVNSRAEFMSRFVLLNRK